MGSFTGITSNIWFVEASSGGGIAEEETRRYWIDPGALANVLAAVRPKAQGAALSGLLPPDVTHVYPPTRASSDPHGHRHPSITIARRFGCICGFAARIAAVSRESPSAVSVA